MNVLRYILLQEGQDILKDLVKTTQASWDDAEKQMAPNET